MLNTETVETFIATHKERAGRVLNVLAKRTPFVDALKSEIGMELLNDCMVEMENILGKIIDETATDADLADFRSFQRIAKRWAERVNEYNKLINKITTNKM